MRACAHACVCVWVCLCVCMCGRVCLPVCLSVCVGVCVWVMNVSAWCGAILGQPSHALRLAKAMRSAWPGTSTASLQPGRMGDACTYSNLHTRIIHTSVGAGLENERQLACDTNCPSRPGHHFASTFYKTVSRQDPRVF